MGIKTKISKIDLPKKYQKYNLLETVDGISHSVYLLDNIYVLKIFENQTKQQILNEQNLLKQLKDLQVPKVIDIFKIGNNYSVIYTQIVGNSIKKPRLSHIKQIGIFLNKQHMVTKYKNNSNVKLFEKERLEQLIALSKNEKLLFYFQNINIKLEINGIIHGDIFTDNVKFKNNKLMGIFDFSEACQGDFLFDLAVIAASWCFDNKKLNNIKLNILLNSYGIEIEKVVFLEYIKYALLYYATSRYINGHNSDELIIKLKYLYESYKVVYEN